MARLLRSREANIEDGIQVIRVPHGARNIDELMTWLDWQEFSSQGFSRR